MNTQWPKGVSGNPNGVRKAKQLSDQLRLLLTQNPDRARKIADKLILMAENGDMEATKIIMDRLEGKAVQQIEIDQTIVHLPIEARLSRILELQAKVVPTTPIIEATPALIEATVLPPKGK